MSCPDRRRTKGDVSENTCREGARYEPLPCPCVASALQTSAGKYLPMNTSSSLHTSPSFHPQAQLSRKDAPSSSLAHRKQDTSHPQRKFIGPGALDLEEDSTVVVEAIKEGSPISVWAPKRRYIKPSTVLTPPNIIQNPDGGIVLRTLTLYAKLMKQLRACILRRDLTFMVRN